MAIKIIVFGTSVRHFPTDVVAGKHLVLIDVVAGKHLVPIDVVAGKHLVPIDVVAGKHLVPIDAIVNIKQETLRRSMGLFEGILGLWTRVFDVIPMLK